MLQLLIAPIYAMGVMIAYSISCWLNTDMNHLFRFVTGDRWSCISSIMPINMKWALKHQLHRLHLLACLQSHFGWPSFLTAPAVTIKPDPPPSKTAKLVDKSASHSKFNFMELTTWQCYESEFCYIIQTGSQDPSLCLAFKWLLLKYPRLWL